MKVVRINKTKRLLAAGELAVGAIIGSPAPELVEAAAVAGFDFVTFDAEHEPLDDSQLVDLIRAAEAFDITPIVRVPKDPDRLLRLLDAGASMDLATIRPTAPDPVWAAAATGVYPARNGIRSAAFYLAHGDDRQVDLLPDHCFSHALVQLGLVHDLPNTSAAWHASFFGIAIPSRPARCRSL